MAQIQRAVEVNFDNPVPKVGIGIEKIIQLVPASAVHQDIGRASLTFERRHRRFDARVICDIASMTDGVLADFTGGFLSSVSVNIENTDLAALLHQTLADRPADPAGTASDNSNFSVQSTHGAISSDSDY